MAIYGIVFLSPRRALAMNHVSPGEEILEVVEIEIFATEEKPLPHARHYVIRVDKEKVTVDRPEMTGAEILEKVKKTPAQFQAL
jgi:hypothetical protein